MGFLFRGDDQPQPLAQLHQLFRRAFKQQVVTRHNDCLPAQILYHLVVANKRQHVQVIIGAQARILQRYPGQGAVGQYQRLADIFTQLASLLAGAFPLGQEVTAEEDHVDHARQKDDHAHGRKIKKAETCQPPFSQNAGRQDVGRRADEGHVAPHQRGKGKGNKQAGEGNARLAGNAGHGRQQHGHGANVVHKSRHRATGEHDDGNQPRLILPRPLNNPLAQKVGDASAIQAAGDNVDGPDGDDRGIGKAIEDIL